MFCFEFEYITNKNKLLSYVPTYYSVHDAKVKQRTFRGMTVAVRNITTYNVHILHYFYIE